MNTTSWSYSELKNFIDNVPNSENNIYEFKERIDLSNPAEVRKDFSAFANSNGGFIFVGIDNNRNIKGISRDDELTTKINRCLFNSALNPSIHFEHQNTISLPHSNPQAYVYIYYIRPSLRHKKPHVSDCKVFVREQGETKPISSGTRMRELFILSKFNPEYIDQLEHDLKKIQQYEYSSTEVDFFYLKYLGKYLDDLKEEKNEKGENSENIDELISLHKNICTIITEAEQLKASERSSTAAPPLSTSDTIKRKYDELATTVTTFILIFKKVHSL